MPWKFRVHQEQKRWQDHPIARISFVLILCLIVASVPYFWGRYQRWNDRRQMTNAQKAFVRGEYREALLRAKAIRQESLFSPAAKDLAEVATAALQSLEAMSWRRMRNAMEAGHPEQLLGLADGFLRSDDLVTAKQVLEKVRPEDRQSGRYHDLEAKLALKSGDTSTAATHWADAIKAAPDEIGYQLELSALQLASDTPEMRTTASATLEEIKAKPGGRLPALRTQLADLTRLGDRANERDLAAEIAADPAAEFSDRLALLTSIHALRPKRDAEFFAYLAELQGVAADSQQDTFLLVSWMVDHELALLVPDWEIKIPQDFLAGPPVAPVIAAAYARAIDWKGLRARTEATNWGDMEFLRLAFLCLALEKLGETEPSRSAWTETMNAAQVRPELLDRLARATFMWGWKERTEEVLWKLAPSEWCPRWAMEYLWSAAWARGDTAKLHEVSLIRLKAQPESLDARNNEVALALLAGDDSVETVQRAEALFNENPKNVFAASTFGFALYRQGSAKEAVALLETFPEEELRRPAIAQYFGVFLAASEQIERADEYLRIATQATSLPEEKSLVDFFTALSKARTLASRGDESGASGPWNEATRAARNDPKRLELLAKLALGWGWQDRAEGALLKLAELDRCPAWAADSLWAAALKTKDRAQIYRASRLVANATPENVGAQNNFLLLALLGRHEKDAPFATIEAFYRKHSDHPEVVATYAFALTREGKAGEAAGLMAALPAEQLSTPRTALYYGLVLAVAGRIEEAQPHLALGLPATQFAEERAMTRILQFAFEAATLDRGGDAKAADVAWAQALDTAMGRADWLEMLVKMAKTNDNDRHANAALWKLAKEDACPRWAIDALWSTSVKTGTSAERYEAVKLLIKADPKDLAARSNLLILALLTGRETEAPLRQVETFYQTNITRSGAIVAYGLALYQGGRQDDARKLFAALPPAQLREPRVALYYGIFLASGETPTEAVEHLRIGLGAPTLPEERALVEKVATIEPLKALLSEAR